MAATRTTTTTREWHGERQLGGILPVSGLLGADAETSPFFEMSGCEGERNMSESMVKYGKKK